MGRKAEYLTGQKFGLLTVKQRTQNIKGNVAWECVCECGNTIIATTRQLKTGERDNCGCVKKIRGKRTDITGKKFGMLTAIRATDEKNKNGSYLWECRCDCGKIVKVSAPMLKKGNNKSCGCLKLKSQAMVKDRLHLVDGTCIEWLKGRSTRSDNKTGYPGIFKKKNGRYQASIGFKKKMYYLGTFDNLKDAVDARNKAKEEIHGTFINAYEKWEEKKRDNPEWAEKHPFSMIKEESPRRLS